MHVYPSRDLDRGHASPFYQVFVKLGSVCFFLRNPAGGQTKKKKKKQDTPSLAESAEYKVQFVKTKVCHNGMFLIKFNQPVDNKRTFH